LDEWGKLIRRKVRAEKQPSTRESKGACRQAAGPPSPAFRFPLDAAAYFCCSSREAEARDDHPDR
jgi:hypothetical protein